MSSFRHFFQELPRLRVAVLGDLMLDTYFFGQVDRVSPEAPVPVVAHQRQEERIGGAGNVALNFKSLGADVQLISIVGSDAPGQILRDLLTEQAVGTDLLFADPNRPTTRKTRVLDRNKQLLRLDHESVAELSPEMETQILAQLTKYLISERPQLLVLEDYNKGMLTPSLIDSVIRTCRSLNIVTAVDPKKKNFFAYRGVDLFKPNWREVADALNVSGDPNPSLLEQVHGQLHERLDHAVSLITLSDKGIFYQTDSHAEWLNGFKRNVADVSGAGDTVIAVAAAAYALTKDASIMAKLANLAGGLVCEQVGTSPIDRERLEQESSRLGWC